MPTPVVMMPPINHMETSKEVQPWMVLPWKCSTKAKIIMMKATKVIAMISNEEPALVNLPKSAIAKGQSAGHIREQPNAINEMK